MRDKNPPNGQSGFTVIETTLFLAISAALVVIALIGTGSLMNSIRFTDSMRTTHAHIQSHYDDILSGFNPREGEFSCGGTGGPGATDCLFLGKLINFDIGSGDIKTYYVIATEIPDLADPAVSDMSDDELIASVNPLTVRSDGTVEEFTVPWGARIFNSKRLSDEEQVNTYAILRSPRSSQLRSYTFNMSRTLLDGGNPTIIMAELQTALTNPENIQRATNFCIRSVDSPDLPAAITVANGQGQNAIALKFDIEDVTQECEGV